MSALKYWLWLTELPGLTNQTRLALLVARPELIDKAGRDPFVLLYL